MTLNDTMTREVLAAVETYVRYYNAKNESGVLGLFSPDISGFGTARDEIVTNDVQFRKLIRADLDPSNAIQLNIRILVSGGVMPVAWITGLCNLGGSMGGKEIRMDGRVTAVLVNRGGRWLFEQIHFSIPG